MVKVRGGYARLEILFWDMLFWLMKGMQHLRDSWTSFIHVIQPSLKTHLVLFVCICALGLGAGFAIGYLQTHLSGW
jgi:hypothetical protein